MTEPFYAKTYAGRKWSKADDDILRKYVGSYSMAAIAKMLKPERTRNAVIGRVHRLNLETGYVKGFKNRRKPRTERSKGILKQGAYVKRVKLPEKIDPKLISIPRLPLPY